jgi:hypothetical protein
VIATLMMERRRLFVLASFALATACPGGAGKEPADAGEVTSFYVDTGADEKALLYNLVGRWYPQEEITRLSDRTLTPEQWCEREPQLIFVYPDSVQVRCKQGSELTAMIAQARREKDGRISLVLRAKEDSPLRQLTFEERGPKATVSGSPCSEGKPVEYGRFPEYEILTRDILGGRRCAQITKPEPAAPPTETPEAPKRE